MKIIRFLAAATLALALPGAALAHLEVTASTPAEGASVKAPRSLAIAFSAPVDPATTGVAIVMTDMPGVPDHGEMVIRNFTPEWAEDRRTLHLALRKPLPRGTYELRWQAPASDGQTMRGVINFVVI